MPLFDLNSALSCELPAANQLADRLSETQSVLDLAETSDDEVARAKITVGIANDPFEAEGYSLGELENQHFFGLVYAETENGHAAGLAPEAEGTPREGGIFRVYLRRQVRESESKSDAYNFFWDRVSAVGSAVVMASQNDVRYPRNYRFKLADRAVGPEFGARRSEGAQGAYLFTMLKFSWGDIETE